MFRLKRDDKDDFEEVALTVSNRTLIRIVLVVVITLALIAAVLKVTHALLLLFVAFFLAIALNAPVAWIAKLIPGKRRGSRSIATTISFLIVIILLGTFIAYIIPPLVHQTEKFVSAAPHLVQNVKSQHTSLGRFIRNHHLQNEVNSLANQVSQWSKHASGKAFSDVKSILSSLLSVLIVLVLTFMMLVEGPRWVGFFRRLVPGKHTDLVNQVAEDMYGVVRGYVNGQVLLSVISAVVLAPVLVLTGVSYPVALIVVVFLTGLVPVIGHTIGALIVTVIALFHSIPAAIIILVYYIVYMLVENYYLQPRIQASSTNMSPLLVLVSLIIGIDFAGLLGGLVAIPVAGCLRVLIIRYLASKKLLPEHATADLITGKNQD